MSKQASPAVIGGFVVGAVVLVVAGLLMSTALVDSRRKNIVATGEMVDTTPPTSV